MVNFPSVGSLWPGLAVSHAARLIRPSHERNRLSAFQNPFEFEKRVLEDLIRRRMTEAQPDPERAAIDLLQRTSLCDPDLVPIREPEMTRRGTHRRNPHADRPNAGR